MALDDAAGTGSVPADATCVEASSIASRTPDNSRVLVKTLASIRKAANSAVVLAMEAGGAAGAAMGAGATATVDAGRVAVHWSASALTAAHTVSKDELVTLTATAATLSSAAFDWLKVDVARDFAQTVALFFSSVFSEPLQQAKAVWGNITNVIALDLGFVFNIDPLPIYITLLTLASLVMLALLVFMCLSLCTTHDAIREGHEHRTWSRKAKDNRCRVTTMKAILFVAASAYLPISKVVLQMFACHPQFGSFLRVEGGGSACSATPTQANGYSLGYECDCKGVPSYKAFLSCGAIVCAVYTVGFPLLCVYLILQNRPRGSRENAAIRYDADGHPQPYTDAMYQCVGCWVGGEEEGWGVGVAGLHTSTPRSDRHTTLRSLHPMTTPADWTSPLILTSWRAPTSRCTRASSGGGRFTKSPFRCSSCCW
jgi:hypothetical protein